MNVLGSTVRKPVQEPSKSVITAAPVIIFIILFIVLTKM